MTHHTIHICDDETGILIYLTKLLTRQGYQVETYERGGDLCDALLSRRVRPDLILLDVRMPDMDGLTLLDRIRGHDPEIPVVIMTAFGTIDMAVEAIKRGAYDYVTKPFPREKILGVIEHALERVRLIEENRYLRTRSLPEGSPEIVFRSREFARLYDLTLQVAASDANILIIGESGTGKELIARTIHLNSPRSRHPFLSINCAALSETLLESQLFGHVRGAFTGAVSTQQGILDEADRGTLFLDEIGDMPPPLQAKLLRVIQEGEFIPVGSTRTKSVDVRFVAATNKDLRAEVEQGRFREDLYYRLNVITLSIPPLRERREDIEPLVDHFIRKFSLRMNKKITGISREAVERLLRHTWPGNIRELENVIERSVILARSETITPDLLPPLAPDTPPLPPAGEGRDTVLRSMDEVERDHIIRVLKGTLYHKSRSAEILGISRKTLDRKIAEYGLEDLFRFHRERVDE